MIDMVTICRKVDLLLIYYTELRNISESLTFEDYKNQTIVKRAVEREIQLIVECATDINNMILRKINNSSSKDYFNSFIDLAENGIIEMEFALKIAPSTGLRNILVHEYRKIDDEIVFDSIAGVMEYYKSYIQQVSKYLGCI